MNENKKHRELHLFDIKRGYAGEQTQMPTVCLLVSDSFGTSLDLAELVDVLVPIGCRYFLTWGAAADDLHDALDEVLEDRGGNFLAAVTASHKGDQIEDIAWFTVNAAMPGEISLRCCVGYDSAANGVEELLTAVRAAAIH